MQKYGRKLVGEDFEADGVYIDQIVDVQNTGELLCVSLGRIDRYLLAPINFLYLAAQVFDFVLPGSQIIGCVVHPG